MSTPYIGEIIMFAGNFAPRGWMFCQGQLLSIAQNTALFAILGTTYGGNGQTTFALPDLRGRYPMQPGQGPGLSPRTLGEQGGSETVTLIASQMPAHTHSLNVSSQAGEVETPIGTVLATDTNGTILNYRAGPIDGTMNPAAIGVAGGSQPHNNMSPFLCLNFIIAVEGVFPSRD
ncbi:tail fiber protein [Myxococcus sp. K15C18031901]|uniref:phage tail protein n=1 Tax=Myxococcus dinghuensis TaxID=2906761 RepID=UPI0020A746C0|nr:tail fiber protein [Myxococcus dinghuensis]MCP3099081.1 tail fiber protein [Myxococcus dinghuensis]